jgi:hypothetical protein
MCSHTFAGFAVYLQLKATVTVAGGPARCGDTMVLAAQAGAVASELCPESKETHTQASRPKSHPEIFPHLQPTFRNCFEGRVVVS